MRLEFQDNIDRYLLNQMSAEERDVFEKKCGENAELQEQLEHTRNVQKIISERVEMLAKIRQWDDEYSKKRQIVSKRRTLYWVYGIAAVSLVGCFYTYIMSGPELKETENLVLMSQSENEQVISFGVGDFVMAMPDERGSGEDELTKIEEKEKRLAERINQLYQKQLIDEIGKEVYNSRIERLNVQKQRLLLRKVQVFIELHHVDEALEILDELRKAEGRYQAQADSLYNLYKK